MNLKENQIIHKKKGRFFYKNALRKYIQSDWYFSYAKSDSVTVGESMFMEETELDAQLISQYEKLPHFIKQYDFRDTLPKQHKLIKEALLNRFSRITRWLTNP